MKILIENPLGKFIEDVKRSLKYIKKLILISPFFELDDNAMRAFMGIVRDLIRQNATVTLIVNEKNMTTDMIHLCNDLSICLLPHPDLHAKIYLGSCSIYGRSTALITSANLTSAALTKNVEVGVLIGPSKDAKANKDNKLFRDTQMAVEKIINQCVVYRDKNGRC